MASSSLPRSYYGPVNPSILGGFDFEESEKIAEATPDLPKSIAGLAIRPARREPEPGQDTSDVVVTSTPGISTSGLAQATPAFRYKAPDPSLFGGFDDETTDETVVKTQENQPIAASPEVFATGNSSFPISLLPGSGASKSQKVQRVETSPSSSVAPTKSTNPYSARIASRKTTTSTETLQNHGEDTTAGPSAYSTDDFGFGQRYQVAGEVPAVVVTNRRVPADILDGEKDCVVCAYTKSVSDFPGAAVTRTCAHPPSTCLECVATSIKSDLNSKLWNEIRCPECREMLQYDDVQTYADPETRERYQNLSFRYAVSEAANFMWCTADCGYGQVHDGGDEEPIVICLLCSARSCFHHKGAWHENLTCDEYDRLMADPANFRSRFELENEAAEEAAAARSAQEDADRAFAQGIVAE